MICSSDQNFCRIFELPVKFPTGFCFGGPLPTTFGMVDWFYPVQDEDQEKDWESEVVPLLREFLSKKQYVRPGRQYLLLTDFGKSFVFSR